MTTITTPAPAVEAFSSNAAMSGSLRKTATAPSRLIRWGGLSAALAGLSFALVGVVHPANVPESVTGSPWEIAHILALGMTFMGIVGMTGLYARQSKQTGWLGLAGYLLLAGWFALILGFTFVEVLLLPSLATSAPEFVAGFLGMFTGTASQVDLGALPVVWGLTGPMYMLGGLLFGIASARAAILPRWASALLAVGTIMAPVAAFLPLAIQPLVAIPTGIALAGLGFGVWFDRRTA